MVFVPTPVHHHESPRVRELAERLRQAITDFERQYPMSHEEIRAALHLAGRASAGPAAGARIALMIVGVVAAIGVAFAVTARATSDGGLSVPVLAGVVAAVAVAFGVMRLARRE
jgi:predicted ATPase with chaperone activity